MTMTRVFTAGLVVLTAVALASGQGLEDPTPARPAVQDLSPEQLQKFFEEARARRLSMERDQVAAEIREGLLFDPDKVDEAIRGLSAGARNTWADNADRIARAFALVDPRFGKAWGQYRRGQNESAAQGLKAIISERDSSYFAAAKRFCYAEALAATGRNEDAVDAYTELVKAMPDRFSYSALALLRAARTYEKMHRLYNAMVLYQAWVDSFGLLDTDTARELAARAAKIAADYRDPLGTLSKKMSDVERRLSAADSGRTTQQKQRNIVAMLDDLIATAEESSGGGQGQGQGQGRGRCPNCGKSDCEGKCQGQGQAQGSKSGPASGIGVPSSPATVSRLVGGKVARPTGLSKIRPSDPSDDWGRLAPRERRKLLETFKEAMPERYRQMIRDYYKSLASGRAR